LVIDTTPRFAAACAAASSGPTPRSPEYDAVLITEPLPLSHRKCHAGLVVWETMSSSTPTRWRHIWNHLAERREAESGGVVVKRIDAARLGGRGLNSGAHRMRIAEVDLAADDRISPAC